MVSFTPLFSSLSQFYPITNLIISLFLSTSTSDAPILFLSLHFIYFIAFETVGNEGWNWQEFLKYMKKVRLVLALSIAFFTPTHTHGFLRPVCFSLP